MHCQNCQQNIGFCQLIDFSKDNAQRNKLYFFNSLPRAIYQIHFNFIYQPSPHHRASKVMLKNIFIQFG
jgi:hypothetical protein